MTHHGEQTEIMVVARGAGWLVVDKPPGLSVHNDPGRDLCARVQRLLTQDAPLADQTGYQPGDGVHAPHRLDRDTSGLVLVCCCPAALTFYSRAFQTGEVGKRYVAILHGRLENPGKQGLWHFPLTRAAGGRANPRGQGKRLASRTVFQVMGHSDHYTLAALSPITGRKHQIRRHAKLAGHPVVGDRRYGSPRSLRHLQRMKGFERLGLHAWGLDLPEPHNATRRMVQSPTVPPAFVHLLAGDATQPAEAWDALLQNLK